MAKRVKLSEKDTKVSPEELKKTIAELVPGKVTDLGDGNAIGESATIEPKEVFNGQSIINHKGYRVDVSKVTGKKGASKVIVYQTNHNDNPLFILNDIILEETAIDNIFRFMEILEGYNNNINDIVKKNNYSNNDVKYDISYLIETTSLDYPYKVMEQFSSEDFYRLTAYINMIIDNFDITAVNELYYIAYTYLGKFYNSDTGAYLTLLEANNRYSAPEFGVRYFKNYNDIKSRLKTKEYLEMKLIHETFMYDAEVNNVKNNLSLFKDVKYYDFNKKMVQIQEDIYHTSNILCHYNETTLELSYGKFKEYYPSDASDDMSKTLSAKIKFFNKYKAMVYDFLKISPEIVVYEKLSSKLRDMMKNEYKYSKEELDNEVYKVSFMNSATMHIANVGHPDEPRKIVLADRGELIELYSVIDISSMTDELVLQAKFIYMLNRYKPTSKEYLQIMQECPVTLAEISTMMDNLHDKGYFLV